MGAAHSAEMDLAQSEPTDLSSGSQNPAHPSLRASLSAVPPHPSSIENSARNRVRICIEPSDDDDDVVD